MPKPDSQETENQSLEQLLALKRHERPDDVYWERFERELHAKPWQKMVTRRSWIRRVWTRLGETVHPAIPVGSTAALALVGYWSATQLTLTADQAAPASAQPAQLAEQLTAEPDDMVAQADVEQPAPVIESAEPQFVVGSFSSEGQADPAFTTVAATHYMPATQRDGVHFAYNTIDSAAHATMAMATGPVRSIY